MATKHLVLFALLALLAACNCRDGLLCNCEEDEFGRELIMEVPIRTYPSKDTFRLGDTLWIEASIEKSVKARGHDAKIHLEGFDFFTNFLLPEISGDSENYDTFVEVVEQVGTFTPFESVTTSGYEIDFVETADRYELKAGIVLYTKGLLSAQFNCLSFMYERSNHPVVFVCGESRRDLVYVAYENTSTTQAAFDSLFLSTKVDYIHELYDYQRYRDLGAHTFVVID